MKKFILGVLLGAVASFSTVAIASDTIQALIFPAKININGVTHAVSDEYRILNVDGHAYVPIRYIAENTGSIVGYDQKNQVISLAYGQINLQDPNDKSISIGDLVVEPISINLEGLQGHIKVDRAATSYVNLTIEFYDKDGKLLGSTDLSDDFKPGIQAFKKTNSGFNSTGYTAVKVRVNEVRDGVKSYLENLIASAKQQDEKQIQSTLSQLPSEKLDLLLLEFMKRLFNCDQNACSYLYPYILNTKANVNVIDKVTGYTPLMYASFYFPTIIDSLLKKNADVNIATKHGGTALMIIAGRNNPDVVKKFLDLGADPNARTDDGGSVLYSAVYPLYRDYTEGAVKTVQYLLNANASVNVTGPEGKSLLEGFKDFMGISEAKQIYDLLVARGAK
ncbi:ankyrin repeat domain-containing protein [Paenibacillus frigoriresistens]|uniref:ankyrin repeat domain-containing protein n=1 Tax=Paenibacillus alginolyticus TaxID=59839 RepID=UPI00156311CE|nr:ankyrin repeat domain-containing protein [Paenibacillus frigoriresistens]NRF92032.1 ankyrin repeat domain-containing protein [Paenibacillus frigoriresistens]